MEEIVIELEPERLALPPPANYERIGADDIPTNLYRFDLWSKEAFAEWPVELMVLAAHARWAMVSFNNRLIDAAAEAKDMDKFRVEYAEWLTWPEDKKDRHAVQRDYRKRSESRAAAWRKAKW